MSYRARGPARSVGIDGKANASEGRRLDASIDATQAEAEEDL